MNSLSAGKCCILLRFPRSLSPIVNDLWQVLTGKIKVLQLLFGKHPNFSKRIKIYPGAGCVAVGKRFGILKYLLNNWVRDKLIYVKKKCNQMIIGNPD